ncbi:MAG: phosphoribosyltransferase [Herminiimonas sp.]|jgi:putative phosphoribosyl transferase|nr:phosphoribosyltransferase [Herminiimonas sp.]
MWLPSMFVLRRFGLGMTDHPYKNREEAGAQLAAALSARVPHDDTIVLALPRGGVPVGFAVAQALQVPLDVLLVRKLGVPGYEEFAMGAVASGGVRVLRDDAMEMFGIRDQTIDDIVTREFAEIERRETAYRDSRPMPQLAGRNVILVDDGLATGSTMLAAVVALREKNPARIIVAVPVGSREAYEKIRAEADEIICLKIPRQFHAVGVWYDDFTQTTDDEVKRLLREAGQPLAPGSGGATANQSGKNGDNLHYSR